VGTMPMPPQTSRPAEPPSTPAMGRAWHVLQAASHLAAASNMSLHDVPPAMAGDMADMAADTDAHVCGSAAAERQPAARRKSRGLATPHIVEEPRRRSRGQAPSLDFGSPGGEGAFRVRRGASHQTRQAQQQREAEEEGEGRGRRTKRSWRQRKGQEATSAFRPTATSS